MEKRPHPFLGILCDTSFIITLLNEERKDNQVAKDFYKFFLDNNVPLYLSSVVVGEFCVCGEFDQLPIEVMRPITYTLSHAKVAANITRAFQERRKLDHQQDNSWSRPRIPNDSMLLGQASAEPCISHFITADIKLKKRVEQTFKGQNEGIFACKVITLEHSVFEVTGALDLNLGGK